MDSKKKKYILLSCGVLLIVACVCIVLIAVTGLGVSLIWPFGQSSTSATEVVVAPTDAQMKTEVAATDVVTEEPTATDEPAVSNFPEEMLDTANAIEEQVQDLRGLTATEDFSRELISEAELADTVRNDPILRLSYIIPIASICHKCKIIEN